MRITLKAVLLVAAVSFTWPAETQACGCAPIVAAPGVTPLEPAVVVLATATRVIRSNSGPDRIHFEVLETLRGSLGPTFEYEESSGSTCAIGFSPGSTYLLYGTPVPEGIDGRVVGANVRFHTCGGSRRATLATDQDLRRLRAVAEGRQPTQVHGWVLVDDANSGRTLSAPVWTNVILEGTETFATVLDGATLRDGYFEFNDVPLGKYRLWVPRATIAGQILGFGRTYNEPSEIEVKDATPVRVVVKVKLAPGSAPVQ
jgi:hypothetical protein